MKHKRKSKFCKKSTYVIIKIYFYEIEDAILLAIHPILNQKICHNDNKKRGIILF